MEATLKKKTTSSYDEALAKLSDALRTHGFGVVTELDVAQTLKQKLGVEFRRYKILGAFDPTLAHRALSASLDVGVMFPRSIVIYEEDDGRASVVVIDPMQTAAAKNPPLVDVASSVKARLEQVLEQVA